MFFRIVILSIFISSAVNSIGQIDIDLLNQYRGRYLGDYSFWLTCNKDSNLVHNDTIIFTANYPHCDPTFGLEFKKLRIKSVGGYKDPFRLVYPKGIAKFYKKEEHWYLRLFVTNNIPRLYKLIKLSKKPDEKASKYAYAKFQYKMIFILVSKE